jgi:hypothetical protein
MDLFTPAHEQRMKSEAPPACARAPWTSSSGKTTLAMVIANLTKSQAMQTSHRDALSGAGG